MDGKTILVVEDNELNMKLIRALPQVNQFRMEVRETLCPRCRY
jgi:CheY-like chemotaxis protein